jgi:DNA-nicking Smr family endonuclease
MSRRRPLSDEEHALWTGVVRSIRPLKHKTNSAAVAAEGAEPAKAKAPSPKLPPEPPRLEKQHEAQPAPAGRHATKEAPPPLTPLGRRLKQRVARGRESIDARIDLHGLTQREAHAALLRFLHRAQADGVRIALVVTGKGTGRGPEQRERGILKRQVPQWLSLPEFRSVVVGFEDAHVGHGGEGALYVRLRRAR